VAGEYAGGAQSAVGGATTTADAGVGAEATAAAAAAASDPELLWRSAGAHDERGDDATR
jgi:hypothetical protein